MAARVAAIHVFGAAGQDMDGWVEPSHDGEKHQSPTSHSTGQKWVEPERDVDGATTHENGNC
jgi:hypothetical protein